MIQVVKIDIIIMIQIMFVLVNNDTKGPNQMTSVRTVYTLLSWDDAINMKQKYRDAAWLIYYPAQVSFWPPFEKQKARGFILSNILIKLYWQNIDNYILLGSILCVKIVANLTQTQNYLHSCKRRFNINISFYYLYTWNTLSACSFAA